MDAIEIIRASYDYWNNKDKNGFRCHFAESSEITASGGLVLHGLAGAEMFWDSWQIAFPDTPTGKHVSAPYSDFFTVDDKIAVNHLYYDQLELLLQLSLMPAEAI